MFLIVLNTLIAKFSPYKTFYIKNSIFRILGHLVLCPFANDAFRFVEGNVTGSSISLIVCNNRNVVVSYTPTQTCTPKSIPMATFFLDMVWKKNKKIKIHFFIF